MSGSVIGGDSLCRSVGRSVSRSGGSIGSGRNKLLVDLSFGHLVRCSFPPLVKSGTFLRMYVGLYVYVLLTDLNEK